MSPWITEKISSQSNVGISELHSEMDVTKEHLQWSNWSRQSNTQKKNKSKLKHKLVPLLLSHTHPYLQMDIAVFEFSLSNQGSFHRSKLCAFWDTPFGEHTSQKPVYIEHQGEAGSRPGQHRPVWDWMQRSMFWTHRGMCIITLFTPYNTKSERTWLSGRHSRTSSEETALSLYTSLAQLWKHLFQ